MTKIVGTLGPKSRSLEVISGCLKAGMSGMKALFVFLLLRKKKKQFVRFWMCVCVCVFVVARFDFSWGDPEYHQETLETLKAAVKNTKKLCAVCTFYITLCFRMLKANACSSVWIYYYWLFMLISDSLFCLCLLDFLCI